jgi:hypothetical protein
VVNKFGFIFLIITNTSYPENHSENSRSLLAYLPRVKNQKQVSNSYNKLEAYYENRGTNFYPYNSYQNFILYGLSAAFFILLFRK